jgi:hypothetical protein
MHCCCYLWAYAGLLVIEYRGMPHGERPYLSARVMAILMQICGARNRANTLIGLHQFLKDA